MRQGMPLPIKIQNAPALTMGLELFLVGFLDLRSSNTDGGVPWGAVQRYCEVHGLDKDQAEDMHYHVSHLQDVLREYARGKEKRHGGLGDLRSKNARSRQAS